MLAGHEQELNRANCLLDLALRLMQLLVMAWAHNELAAWVQSLNQLEPASSTWVPPGLRALGLAAPSMCPEILQDYLMEPSPA